MLIRTLMTIAAVGLLAASVQAKDLDLGAFRVKTIARRSPVQVEPGPPTGPVQHGASNCCEQQPSCCDNIWKGYCKARKLWCHKPLLPLNVPQLPKAGCHRCGPAPCGKGCGKAACGTCGPARRGGGLFGKPFFAGPACGHCGGKAPLAGHAGCASCGGNGVVGHAGCSTCGGKAVAGHACRGGCRPHMPVLGWLDKLGHKCSGWLGGLAHRGRKGGHCHHCGGPAGTCGCSSVITAPEGPVQGTKGAVYTPGPAVAPPRVVPAETIPPSENPVIPPSPTRQPQLSPPADAPAAQPTAAHSARRWLKTPKLPWWPTAFRSGAGR